MKKLLALVIALAMVLSVATVFVSAEDESEPEGYLWITRADDTVESPGIHFKVPGSVIADAPITIKALVKFSEDCQPNGGCVFLNMYSYAEDSIDDFTYLVTFVDYAKDTTVEKGKWVEIDSSIDYPTLNPHDGTYGSYANQKVDPAVVTLGIGFYLATGTIYVGYISVEQNGEEIWGIDFADGFDVGDSDDLGDIAALTNITPENKDDVWGCVSATVNVDPDESEPAQGDESTAPSEPVETKEENIAAGKTYTVSGNDLRGDGWDDASGTKLTDGVYATDASTDFFGMKGSIPEDPEANAEVDIVIDLGEVTDFSKITADATYGDWGISAPGGVKFAVSEDGTNFTEVADVAADDAAALEGFSGNWSGILFSAEGEFTGRYVKVTYYKANDGQSNHIWISELEVIGEVAAEPDNQGNQGNEQGNQGTGTPDNGDAGIIALAVVSAIALGGAVIVKKSK